MNTLLELKMEKSDLSDRDKFEIRQFFNIVDNQKKQNILKNFDQMVFNINKIKAEIIEEQEILLWKAISNMERAIKRARSSWIRKSSKENIQKLKITI